MQGVPPATVAEFTLGLNGLPDNYDGELSRSQRLCYNPLSTGITVSLVDGYNLPVRISNNKGCPVADCPVDLGPNCPAEIQGPFDSNGFPVGCKSACEAGLGGDPGMLIFTNHYCKTFSDIVFTPANNPNCCTGSHNTPATCPPSGVQYYSYFSTSPSASSACPRDADCMNGRAKLPQQLRIRVRRVERYRALDLRRQPRGRLHHHLLPLKIL